MFQESLKNLIFQHFFLAEYMNEIIMKEESSSVSSKRLFDNDIFVSHMIAVLHRVQQ